MVRSAADMGLAIASLTRSAIAINGSFFNTQRMLTQYVSNAYYPKVDASSWGKLPHNPISGTEFARTV
jgi:hypothetical protein